MVQNLVKGRYKLVVETDGYKSERLWINVPADKLVQVDFAVKLPEAHEPVADESEQVYFGSCAAARAVGAAPLYAGSPGYRSQLDRDKDGVACEWLVQSLLHFWHEKTFFGIKYCTFSRVRSFD